MITNFFNDKENEKEIYDFDDFVNDLDSWKELLKDFTKTIKFKEIFNKINLEYKNKKIYPPKKMIFNSFKLTKLQDIKVVIVGQDPYHQPGQAMGLAFSVGKNVKIPPSLNNIYKCLVNDPDIKNFVKPQHGDLTKWAEQGVLMLNDVLTVEDSKAHSHKKFGWTEFTDFVIEKINKELDGVVFLLWGLPAKKKAIKVDREKHYILESVHPSPLSASKGFLDCQHFSKINSYLKLKNKKEINWNLI